MSEVSFTTSQNVTIDYEIASLGDRIVACLIDYAVKIGYVLLLFFISYQLSKTGLGKEIILMWFLLLLPVMFYSLFFEMAMQGQTPGKRVRSIRVVKLDGSQPNNGGYVMRWIFRLVDLLMFSGVIAVIVYLVNGKGQRIGDILAGTCVIRTRDRVQLKDTIYERLNYDHQITFPEVYKLSEKDIEIIKKVLGNQEYLDNFEMVLSLSAGIESKMGVKREMAIEEFLHIVVQDFNYYAGTI